MIFRVKPIRAVLDEIVQLRLPRQEDSMDELI